MKCIILAAGYATRLYPLTENFPKPLLEVADKSILDWLLEDIDKSGSVDEYIVVSNHKFASHFVKWADERNGSRRYDARITVLDDGTSTNETRLGAVCDIKFAVDTLGLDDDLLVIAGDNLLDFSLTAFLDYAKAKGTSCVMRYEESDLARLRKCAVACVDDDDFIISLEEKPSEPRSHWACPPFYFYTRENAGWIGRGIASGCGTDAPGSYLAWLCANAPVHAMLMPGKRYDIGNLESYRKVQETFKATLHKSPVISFNSDYLEGCCPQILQKLQETNCEQTPGCGRDDYCARARDLIRSLCGTPDADVHFLVGGTQTNATVIASVLRPYQGVMCASTGHINVHETGAIEHTGHKVLALRSDDGKVNASAVRECMENHFNQSGPEHEVQPGMLYISYPTELGTLYTKSELSDLKSICDAYDIPLFIDGARLGYGLASENCDMTLQELASLCDVFYIGGTKQGALFGEAVVICNEKLKKDFRYFIKQGGGMLAKGRLLGLQFLTLLSPKQGGSNCGNGLDGTLYFGLAREADRKAAALRDGFAAAGCEFLVQSFTNQIFPILDEDLVSRLEGRFDYQLWTALPDGRKVGRFCTSWQTPTCNVDALLNFLAK